MSKIQASLSNILLKLELQTPFAVEDLNLNAVESLRGVPYLAIGKHLCGPATGNHVFHLNFPMTSALIATVDASN